MKYCSFIAQIILKTYVNTFLINPVFLLLNKKNKKGRKNLNHQVFVKFVWEYLYSVVVPFFLLNVHELIVDMVTK